MLLEGTGIHPDKPLEGFSLVNVSGTCLKGISLANIKNAKPEGIMVTGYKGPPLSTYQVSGSGLEGAVSIESPKVPEAIAAPAQPYRWH